MSRKLAGHEGCQDPGIDDSSHDSDRPFDVLHGVDRLAQTMAIDLVEHHVAALSLYPGTVRTERMLEAVALSDGAYNLDDAQSPALTGRAVVALATDPNVMARTGQALAVANLAHEYGFSEDDGSQPPPIELT